MEIMAIGFTEENQYARLLVQGFRELGYTVTFHHPWKILHQNLSEYGTGQDLTMVFQSSVKIHVDLPNVVYFHMEPYRRPSVDKCDFLFMESPTMHNFLACWYPELFERAPKARYLWYGVDLNRFNPNREKTIDCSFMGSLEWKAMNFVEVGIYSKRKEILCDLVDYVKLWPNPKRETLYEEYIHSLEISASTVIVHGKECYISQRIFEAAAAGCCPMIYVDNDKGKKLYDEMGLIESVNCVFIWAYQDVITAILNKDLIRIGQAAREWVKNHTYLIRAMELLTYVQKNLE